MKYRILYTSSFADMVGGGQKSLFLLLKALDAERFEPILVLPRPGTLVGAAHALHIETEIVPMVPLKIPNFIKVLKAVFRLRAVIRERKIDMVHTDSPRPTFYAALAKVFLNVPLIWQVRTAETQDRYFERILFAFSDKIIAVSEACARKFQAFKGFSGKVAVVYNGIDLEEFNGRIDAGPVRRSFGIEDADVVIGCVSRIHRGKGLEDLLAAARRVVDDAPKTKFLIVGEAYNDSGLEASLRDRLSSSGLRGKVLLIGFREDVREIMAAIDIFVLPTCLAEGFSRSILEAMASSRPVITTPLGGNTEAVVEGVTGLFVPPHDPARLAEAIMELVKDELRRKEMGMAGRERVAGSFAVQDVTKKIENIYLTLAAQSGIRKIKGYGADRK